MRERERERATGGAAGILQSELVPWTELLKAHSLPSLCTRQLRREQILEASITLRTAHQGNDILSPD